MSNVGKENISPNPEFGFVMKDGKTVHRWIGAVSALSESSMVSTRMPAQTRLVEEKIGEGLFNYVSGGISINTERADFNFAIQYIYKKDDNAKPKPVARSISMAVSMEELMQGNGYEAMIPDISMPLSEDDRLDWKKFANRLRQKTQHKNFSISRDDPNKTADLVSGDDTFSVVDASIMGNRVLQVSFNDYMDITQEDFLRKYEKIGLLAKQVFDSAYAVSGFQVPSKTVEVKPPRRMEAQTQQYQSILRMAETQLNMMGGLSDENTRDELKRKIELTKNPNVHFDEIGGLEGAKQEIMTVMDGLLHPEIFESEGTRPPKGVLLYGEPGGGKTMLAKALATEAGVPFFSVELADIVNHLYGRSEKLIAEVFELARQEAPSVIFIDELDALAAQRNQSSEVTSRLVSVLLTCLDGIDRNNENVVMIGATNRLDAIDSAIVRPGRMDMLIEVPKPDIETRGAIFGLKIKAAETRAGRQLFDKSAPYDRALTDTNDMSPADIEEIIRRVLIGNVRAKIAGQEVGLVTEDRIVQEIKNYEPSRKARRQFGLGGNVSAR